MIWISFGGFRLNIGRSSLMNGTDVPDGRTEVQFGARRSGFVLVWTIRTLFRYMRAAATFSGRKGLEGNWGWKTSGSNSVEMPIQALLKTLE